MVKAKRPPKTIKEKKFVKEYSKDGNGTRAAAEVYDVSSNNSAAVIASQMLRKLNIGEVLDNAGLTDKKMASVLVEAIEATKPISAVSGKDASEASMDFIDVPDWQARLKAIEISGKMKGHFIERRDLTTKGEKIMPNNYVSFEKDDPSKATS